MSIFTKPVAVGLIGALALAGCATTPGSGDNPRTTNGAIIGGLIGGLIGAKSADDNHLARGVVGAGIGAAVGGVIGQQLDRQARDLQADLGNDDVTVVNTGSELIVTMPQDILFATDSAAIRGDLQSDLRVLARNLQDYPNSTVEVIGHTDNTGSASYNQDLSSRRASAVAGVLLEAGVAPSRVRSFGRGEDEPVATNLNPEGRAQNRRVEIIIRPTR